LRNFSTDGLSVESVTSAKLEQKSEIQKKRVSILSNRNSPSMFRTETINQPRSNHFSLKSNSKLAFMATLQSAITMLPRDTINNDSTQTKLRASNSSKKTFKIFQAAPTKYLSNKSSRILENSNEE
jgi:hypothetical protein